METLTIQQPAPPVHAIISTARLCPSCSLRPVVVYLRADALYFADARCDQCATHVLNWAALSGGVMTIDRAMGAPVITMIDGIDVAQLVVEVLDCAVGSHDVRAVQGIPGAVAAVITVIADKVRRELLPSEQAAVIDATRSEFVRRSREKRANLAETQRSLHNPMARMFVA